MNTDQVKDVEVTDPPTDVVTALEFSPKTNHLASTSYDRTLRIWDVNTDGQTLPVLGSQFMGGLLGLSWAGDGTKIYTAGRDGLVSVVDLCGGGVVGVVGRHEKPVKAVKAVQGLPWSVVSGGWDRMVHFWDLRQERPAVSVDVGERVHSLDVRYPLMIVGTAERKVFEFDLSLSPSIPHKTTLLPWYYGSIRAVRILPSPSSPHLTQPAPIHPTLTTPLKQPTPIPTRYAIAGSDARVGVTYTTEPERSFTFKCHRVEGADHKMKWSVNGVEGWPGRGGGDEGIFVTFGSDGRWCMWNADKRQRISASTSCGDSISAGSFHFGGEVFAYGASAGGEDGNMAEKKETKIFLHLVREGDVRV